LIEIFFLFLKERKAHPESPPFSKIFSFGVEAFSFTKKRDPCEGGVLPLHHGPISIESKLHKPAASLKI